VHFDFDLNGILTVTTTEKGKGQQGTLVVDNVGTQKLSSHELKQARADLDALFEFDETIRSAAPADEIDAISLDPELAALIDRAQQALPSLDEEQAEELQTLLDQLDDALAEADPDTISELQEELSDFLYYVTPNTP
jgi:molecular chaperone DnaK